MMKLHCVYNTAHFFHHPCSFSPQVKYLVLLCGDDEDSEIVKAASGALAMLTSQSTKICKKVFDVSIFFAPSPTHEGGGITSLLRRITPGELEKGGGRSYLYTWEVGKTVNTIIIQESLYRASWCFISKAQCHDFLPIR